MKALGEVPVISRLFFGLVLVYFGLCFMSWLRHGYVTTKSSLCRLKVLVKTRLYPGLVPMNSSFSPV